MNTTNKYYQHSGAVGLIGPMYMVLLGTLSTLILGALYGYAIAYIPLIYFNFFITLGFGGCVGYLVGTGGASGKVRNTKIVLLFGLLFGFLAQYVGWMSWIFAYSDQEVLVFMPSDIWVILQSLSESGAWSIFDWTPTGPSLYAIWGIEATVIIGASVVFAWTKASTPFCEHCNQWIKAEDIIEPLEPINNLNDLRSTLEHGNYEPIQSLNKMDTRPDAYTQITLLHCPDCQHSYLLTLKSITVKDEKDGENVDETTLVENLIITPEQYTMIKAKS